MSSYDSNKTSCQELNNNNSQKSCRHRQPLSPSRPILQQQQQQVGRKNNKINMNKVVKTVVVVVGRCLFLHCEYDTINKLVANAAITAATFAIKDLYHSRLFILHFHCVNYNKQQQQVSKKLLSSSQASFFSFLSVKKCRHHRRPLSPPPLHR